MASIYRKSTPRTLAWPRRSLRQRQAGLQGLVEVFASVKQACMASSKSSPASSRLAWPRRSLRQRQTGLHGLVEVFASVKQACRASSKSSPASSRLARPRRSLRQRQAGLLRFTVNRPHRISRISSRVRTVNCGLRSPGSGRPAGLYQRASIPERRAPAMSAA